MTASGRRLATGMLGLAARRLPAALSPWARAMEHELAEIADDKAATMFALGCLRGLIVMALANRCTALLAAARNTPFLPAPSDRSYPPMTRLSARPRLLGLFCALAAVALGLAYMSAAGAPTAYLVVNLAALILGASLWLALGRAAGSRLPGAGAATFAGAVALLLTAWFGIAADGASRWISLGPVNLQVSLVLVPVMLVIHARQPDRAGTAGMLVAALALALQPDRAMAGVLAAGLLARLWSDRSRLASVAAAGAILAFGWTLIRPDRMPAVPYVDRILFTAFDVHPLAGAAVLTGAALLLVPAIVGAWKHGGRPALLAFGGGWAGAIAAAALGNYPTPLVGYGGSFVLGYLLSVALLPVDLREAAARRAAPLPATGETSAEARISDLRAANVA